MDTSFYLGIFMGFSFGVVFYEAFFVYSFKRRPYFWWRLAGALVSIAGITVAMAYIAKAIFAGGMPVTVRNVELARVVANTIFFLLGVGAIFLCFDEKPQLVLFAAVAASATHVVSSSFYNIWMTLFSLPSVYFVGYDGFDPITYLAFYLPHAGITAISWLVFGRAFAKANKVFGVYVGKSIIGLFIIYFFFNLALNGSQAFNSKLVEGTPDYLYDIFMIVFAVFVLFTQRFSLVWAKDVQEKEAEHQFHENYRRQAEEQQANMQLINLKCHDLKHQIRTLLAGQNLDETFVEEVQRTINIYDAHIRTGNEALDVLLTEKSLLCDVKKIQITVMIEGECLSFMETMDVNSFFGNATDNAIEYLLTVDEDKRFIRITSTRHGSVFSVRVENYCEAELSFGKNGLPKTTKKDKNYHGFGTQSVKAVAEKYGGSIAFSREDDLFVVSAMFML